MLFGFTIARYGAQSGELTTALPRLGSHRGVLPVRVMLAALLWLMAPGAGLAVNQVDRGFDLEELVGMSGAGDDPGAGNLQARLDWAVQVAIPANWREELPVSWEVGSAGSGQLAVSYVEGRSVIAPNVLAGSPELVLSTVAHEMGHQIAFQMVEPFNGYPPQEFIDRSEDYFLSVREGWADCVSRAWTGSRQHTLSESRGCPNELANYTATLIEDPVRLRPEPTPSPAPQPSRPVSTPTPSPSPSPVASPIEHPLMSDFAQPSPTPTATATPGADSSDGSGSFPLGLLVLAGVIAIVVLAGKPFRRFWTRLRKKISGDL